MRKLLILLLAGAAGTSCVTTTKIYRDPNYKMNKRETVYIEKADRSYIYSDAQLEQFGDILKAAPDKKVAEIYRIDSLLYKQLKALNFKPELVEKGWRNDAKGLLISYKDYWINESDPSFYRFWLKGMSLKDSTRSLIYEGAPVQSTTKVTPEKEVKQSILELLTAGIEQEPDETDYYITHDDEQFPKSKFYLSANFGIGRSFGNSYSDILPSEKKHKDALKSGYSVNADAAYFFMPYYGVGVSFSSFMSAEKQGTVNTESGFSPKYLSDQVGMLYVGPAFYLRNLAFKGRFSTVLSISGGYLRYTDDQKVYTDKDFSQSADNKMTVGGFGGKVGLSLEYLLTPSVGLGLSSGLIFGRQTVTNELASVEQKTQKLWMNHVTIGLGIRLYR